MHAMVSEAAGTAPKAAVDTTRARLDESTFNALYSRVARPLAAYVRKLVRDATAADDIVQETFCRLLRQPVPTHDDEALRRYVFRIASNLATDHWRKSGGREIASEDIDAHAAPPTPDLARKTDVQRSFGSLKPRERALLWLAYVEGSDHAEIAASLGLKEKSIKVLLFRARKRLGDLLSRTGVLGGRR